MAEQSIAVVSVSAHFYPIESNEIGRIRICILSTARAALTTGNRKCLRSRIGYESLKPSLFLDYSRETTSLGSSIYRGLLENGRR